MHLVRVAVAPRLPRLAEVWVQLAAELGAGPEQLAAVRVSGGTGAGLLGTAPQP